MGKMTSGSIIDRRALNQVLMYAQRAPVNRFLEPGQFVRVARAALRMSQADLARRSGLRQSHVAILERGVISPRWETLRRMFDAMYCDLFILPRGRKRLGDVVAERRLERSSLQPRWK